MKQFEVVIEPTANKSIVKFETNHFLTNHTSYEFDNIEQAKQSPLAQQLFHLPFVKRIFIAQNFIAIDKYDIVEWEDVQQEVADQIKKQLNEGVEVIQDTDGMPSKVPVTIYAESTPNPSVLKFVANKKLVTSMLEFKNIDEAKDAPLAQSLFHFPFVKEVFMDENYISIHKYDMADWQDITLEIREFLKKYIEDNKPVYTGDLQLAKQQHQAQSVPNTENYKNLDETSQDVISIIDEYIKPAVASDGGNILFDSYDQETKTVKVILQGACSGCPSSTFTLKNGIETMLKEMLAGKVEYVEAING
ncbi:NifU family protein [Aquimarina sp. ERC-38]|uniref:NifU family protein n=1 Tax=Aquimarina sp. ERC-38 TaxID=2949996 RepID=UPI0022464EA6|nr:NifU family protein [Aquimarina sp. ERC-38]UZO82635.1 NifU family protein [Aquimarina sp. ERC-38]